jgi:hypothetical protein
VVLKCWVYRLDVGYLVAYWPVETISPIQRGFRDYKPSRSALPVTIAPRLFSCLRIKQAVARLPARLDTRPVAAVTEAGFPPTRIRDIAQPQPTEPLVVAAESSTTRFPS